MTARKPRSHGYARYKWGPDEHGTPGKGCRCGTCREAVRTAANQRNRLIAYGQWQPFTGTGRAREHLEMLAACGIGPKQAAVLAGIGRTTAARILAGTLKRIRPATEQRILAARPSLRLLPAAVMIDATGTRRRIQALIACGWSQRKLAARLPMSTGALCGLLSGPRVRAGTAVKVRALYDELWNMPPPSGSRQDRVAASRARNYAAARDWARPAAWDDDRIDDPAGRPAAGWRRGGEAA